MPICRQCKHIADCQLDAIVNNLTFDPNFNAEYCVDFEMFSNADRIRSMSDEELAELFRDIYNAGGEYAENWYVNGSRQSCFEWDEEWLKQPAEVE